MQQHHLGIAYSLQQHDFIQRLQLLAIVLLASSALYLVAANWFMLPKLVQIFIPQTLLLGAAIVSVVVEKDYVRQAFEALCGLMLGLSLATLGQVYQTGADSYQLFLLWSILLLPWLYRYNLAVYLQFCIVSQLALILFFKQTFYEQSHYSVYLFSIIMLGLVQFFFSLKKYPRLAYLFVVWFTILSVYSAFQLTEKNEYYLIHWLVFLLPNTLALLFFYRKQQQLGVVLAGIGLLLAFLTFIFGSVFPHLGEVEIFIFGAIAVFAVFALLAYGVAVIFKGGRFHVIPLSLGAWLASLFLAALILVLWGDFSLFGAILFMVAGCVALGQSALFVRQLGYSLFISGQLAFLIHLFIKIDLVWVCLIAQSVIMVLLFICLKKLHWLFALLQMLIVYGLLVLFIAVDAKGLWHDEVYFFDYVLLLNYICFSSIFLLESKKFEPYYRSFILLILLVSLSDFLFSWIGIGGVRDFSIFHHLYSIVSVLWLLIFAWRYLYRQVDISVLIALLVLGAIFIGLGYFKLFIILMLLAWSWAKQDKLLYYCCLLIFGLFLWHLYYQLNITFLFKSLTIFCSGIAVWGLAYLLQNSLAHKYKEVK